MRSKRFAVLACGAFVLACVTGCPVIQPPVPLADFGQFVRERLADKVEAPPVDIADDEEFDTEKTDDDFGDVLTDPAFEALAIPADGAPVEIE